MGGWLVVLSIHSLDFVLSQLGPRAGVRGNHLSITKLMVVLQKRKGLVLGLKLDRFSKALVARWSLYSLSSDWCSCMD